MRHRRLGRNLSRSSAHRKALFRNLAQSVFEHGRITTTLPKAKEVQPFVEKLISLAKAGSLHHRRMVIALLQDRRLTNADQEFTGQSVVQKLFSDIAPQFADRNGGYTRIVKLPRFRIGDGGDLVSLQLVGGEEAPRGTPRKSKGLRRQRAERRHQFASKVAKGRTAGTAVAEAPAAAVAEAPAGEAPATE